MKDIPYVGINELPNYDNSMIWYSLVNRGELDLLRVGSRLSLEITNDYESLFIRDLNKPFVLLLGNLLNTKVDEDKPFYNIDSSEVIINGYTTTKNLAEFLLGV